MQNGAIRKDLHQFLLGMHEVDERLPECIQRICRLPAPTLPDWGGHAAEKDGLSYDKDKLK